MDGLKFVGLGSIVLALRLLLLPINIILLILMAPGYLILNSRKDSKSEKYIEMYNKFFLYVFGPPFGFFPVAIVIYIGIIIQFVL